MLEQLAYGYGGEAPPPDGSDRLRVQRRPKPRRDGQHHRHARRRERPAEPRFGRAAGRLPARLAGRGAIPEPRHQRSRFDDARRRRGADRRQARRPLQSRDHHGHPRRRRRALGQCRRHRHRGGLRPGDARPDALRHRHPRPVSAGPRHGRLQLDRMPIRARAAQARPAPSSGSSTTAAAATT